MTKVTIEQMYPFVFGPAYSIGISINNCWSACFKIGVSFSAVTAIVANPSFLALSNPAIVEADIPAWEIPMTKVFLLKINSSLKSIG